MRLKGVRIEDFTNYKLPSLFLSTCQCNWKCCLEANIPTSICQNSSLASSPTINLPDEQIYNLYSTNPITKCVVIGGLEPFMQFDEIISLIDLFRKNNEDCPFIIYTGFYPQEIEKEIIALKRYKNIVIKFGRFIPNQQQHYDEVLGVQLASNNQYAEQIS